MITDIKIIEENTICKLREQLLEYSSIGYDLQGGISVAAKTTYSNGIQCSKLIYCQMIVMRNNFRRR